MSTSSGVDSVVVTTAIEEVAGERSISELASFSEDSSTSKFAGSTAGAVSPRPMPSSLNRPSFFFAKKTPKLAPG